MSAPKWIARILVNAGEAAIAVLAYTLFGWWGIAVAAISLPLIAAVALVPLLGLLFLIDPDEANKLRRKWR